MANFEQYDVWQVVLFTTLKNPLFTAGFWMGTGVFETPRTTIGFKFNTLTGEFSDINAEEEVDEECVYVNNVVDELVALYERKKAQEDFSISNDIVFYSIVKYFEINFKQESQIVGRGLDRCSFVFIIPNEWQLKTDIIDYVMVPLLENMGVNLQDRSQRVMFITWLEAKLWHLQYSNPSPLLKIDNRCIWYDIHVNERAVTISTVYFQVKEDGNLRFARNVFVPKIISLGGHLASHNFDLKTTLGNLVVSELNAFHLIDIPYGDNNFFDYRNVTDCILDMILGNIQAYICEGVNFDFDTDIIYDYTFLERYLDSSQIAIMHSQHFFDTVIHDLLSVVKSSNCIFYIRQLNSQVPFHRKTIFICGHITDDWYWFETKITTLFILLLQDNLQNQCEDVDLSTWYYPPEKVLSYLNVRQGARRKALTHAAVSNAYLPPVVMARYGDNEFTDGGTPLYTPVEQDKIMNSTPDLIAYIDVHPNSIQILFEIVDHNGIVLNQLNIDTSSITARLPFFDLPSAQDQSAFARSLGRKRLVEYLRNLIELVDVGLVDNSVNTEKMRYVLCLEKVIMEGLQIKSRILLQNLIKKNKVVKPNRKVIAVDQGEKTVWSMYQKEPLKARSYYLHAHLSDDCIYLKLKKAVDTKESNGHVSETSILYIKDNYIHMKNVYEQISEAMWCYIQSLEDTERQAFITFHGNDSCDSEIYYRSFKRQLRRYIRQEFFSSQCNQDFSDIRITTRAFQLSDDYRITIVLHQLFDIAIIPVIKNIAATVLSSLMDEEQFGYFEIAKLFVTGNFARIKESSTMYHNIVMTSMKDIFLQLIRRKTYNTKLEIDINTSLEDVQASCLKQKAFYYDTFFKGELRIVSHWTWCLNTQEAFENKESVDILVDGSSEGSESVDRKILIMRGEELTEKKRMKVWFIPKEVCSDDVFNIVLCLNDEKNAKGHGWLFYRNFLPSISTSTLFQAFIEVEILHDKSILLISIEYLSYNEYGEIFYEKEQLLDTVHRLTLRYF